MPRRGIEVGPEARAAAVDDVLGAAVVPLTRRFVVRDEVAATGGSLYFLSHADVVEGSEQVTIVVRDKLTGLVQSRRVQRQTVDHAIIMVFILFGNGVYFLIRRREKKEARLGL